MLHSVGLQLPLENTSIGSDNSIDHSVANVKTYRENLDNFAKIEYNNTSNRKKLSRQRELSNDLTKLDSRGRSSSDEVAVYSSEHTMERMLMQKLDDCQVVISESPDATAEWCKTHRPDVLLMEVKAYSPWMFKERMAIRDKVKRNTESCRVILFVDDDTDEDLTEKVRQAKREGLIDAFLFGSVSENYFASVIDSV